MSLNEIPVGRAVIRQDIDRDFAISDFPVLDLLVLIAREIR